MTAVAVGRQNLGTYTSGPRGEAVGPPIGDKLIGEEPMGVTEVNKSVSLTLPATLDELEDFCAALRTETVAGITPVRAGPVDGTRVRLYVNITENPARG